MSKPTGKGWIKLGAVGVDSGQLLITDPCYLTRWVSDDPLGHEVLLHTSTGKRYQWVGYGQQIDEGIIPMGSYEELVPGTDKTFNQLVASGEMVEIPWDEPMGYDYRGACLRTNTPPNGGEIGVFNAGVVFSSGYGDGCYEVWGRTNKDGRIVEVRILMD